MTLMMLLYLLKYITSMLCIIIATAVFLNDSSANVKIGH